MAEPEKKSHWKLVVNIITVLALIVLVIFIWPQIKETFENLSRVNAYALLLILPIQFVNYESYARMYHYLFGILGNKTRYWDMFKVSLELNLVNHVFPSGGVSGFSYFGVRMKDFGVSPGKATLVQTMKFVLLFVSFEILLIVGLLFLAIGNQANNVIILVASSIATVLLLGTVGAAVIIGSKTRINSFFTYVTRFVNKAIHLVRPKNPETISIANVTILMAAG